MAGTRGRGRPAAGARRTTRSQAQATPSSSGSGTKAVPKEYRQMLREAGVHSSRPTTEDGEPPPKRLRRPGQRVSRPAVNEKPIAKAVSETATKSIDGARINLPEDSEPSDDDLEFEDVALPEPTIQTTYLDSDEEDQSDSDNGLGDVDFGALPGDDDTVTGNDGVLQLEISTQPSTSASRKGVVKRKPISKAEREKRIEIHKMHICCLLVHAALRNRWCDDAEVQALVRPLLSDKIVDLLNPRKNLSQFGRSESLKDGIQQARILFNSAFKVTERGIKRALWAEDPSQLADYQLPDDLDSALDKKEFRKSAKYLDGSRDVGAQLFCALLRSVGVQARLVCSLQPLSFVSGAPNLPKPRPKKNVKSQKPRPMADYDSMVYNPPSAPGPSFSAARRLGHPNAADYIPPPMQPKATSTAATDLQSHKPIKGESPFPVYWVEVLDESHQKWQPVDPLVTCSQWKPAKLEPPLVDKLNCLTYAIAFSSDGVARDVTRRYAKAYTSKTRKMRVDNPQASLINPAALSGEEWYEKAMGFFRRPYGIVSDLDRIEEAELNGTASREPMPRNVADFKDHPVFALQRHLRRNEVLVPDAKSSGTVAAGKGQVERIYRRRDVRIAWSADKWYRLGRVIKLGEEPVKYLPKRPRPTGRGRVGRFDSDDEEEDPVLGTGGSAAGTPIFSQDQTELFVPDPVRKGKVPRNKFGNVDVFVPSMVPRGGVHINNDLAPRAAYILGVDYAPALTGFEFKGRQGTAVLKGAVVPIESEEAIMAIINAIQEMEADAEEERRQRRLLRMWSKFLKVLRIDERVYAGFDPSKASNQTMMAPKDKGKQAEESQPEAAPGHSGSHLITKENDDESDDMGGGFMPSANDDDEDMGGGFLVD
ncbi:hypothetical protein ACKVV1_009521 [Pyricularia oryzae]